ncbi:MAG: hypothetical protein ABIQ44_03580 [Chloroflexia bacterium]
MMEPKVQRIIGWAAFVGVFTACAAVGLIWQNQVQLAIIAVVVADIILLPTFMILLRTRRKTKKIVRKIEDQQQEQLDALAEVGEIVQPQQADPNRNE